MFTNFYGAQVNANSYKLPNARIIVQLSTFQHCSECSVSFQYLIKMECKQRKKDCYRSLGCTAWLVHAESRMLQDSQEQFGKKRKGSVVFPYQTKG